MSQIPKDYYKLYKEYNYIIVGFFSAIEEIFFTIYKYIEKHHFYYLTGKRKHIVAAVILFNILDRLDFQITQEKMSILAKCSRTNFRKIDGEFRSKGIMIYLNTVINKKESKIKFKKR